MNLPAVSVVMPVRNAFPYLGESIGSILAQTFEDFELVIGDDGSTDGSTRLLREWAARDPRIRLFERQGEALGPARSSDWVARLARAPLVARMDADDISRPDRLERQVAVLRSRPGAVMVASLWEGIDDRGRKVHGRDRSNLLTPGSRPFMHGSILYRRDAFERVGGYRPLTDYWEDGDLFHRMAAAGQVLVLPEPLYQYRYSGHSSRFDPNRRRVETALQLGMMWGRHGRTGIADERVLRRWRREIEGRRIDPRIFLGIGYSRIWCGRRAGIMAQLCARARLRPDRQSLRVLLWAAAGGIAPRALRLLLRARISRRDAAAAALVQCGSPYPWPVGNGSSPAPAPDPLAAEADEAMSNSSGLPA